MDADNSLLRKAEGPSYRSEDGNRRVAVFYEDGGRDLRVEVSIAIDRLPEFYGEPARTLGEKRERADKILRATLDQFLAGDPNLASGELRRVSEEEVDLATIRQHL